MKSSERTDGRKNARRSGREVLAALLTILITLGAGGLIQTGLHMRQNLQEERAGMRLLLRVTETYEDLALVEEKKQRTAASRLALLPEERQKRLDDLHLDLLTIVSAAVPLKEGYVPVLDTVVEDYKLDERCAAKAWQMMQDCREAGAGYPMICSAYRTEEFQSELYENKVVRVQLEKWCPIEEAREKAALEVAPPGTSEHQLGLAADIIDETFPYLNEWQETTGTQRWLKEHAAEYGFILRYPNGTTDITGIVYEPWHYRYVGEKFAAEITAKGVTLEEYVAWRRGR